MKIAKYENSKVTLQAEDFTWPDHTDFKAALPLNGFETLPCYTFCDKEPGQGWYFSFDLYRQSGTETILGDLGVGDQSWFILFADIFQVFEFLQQYASAFALGSFTNFYTAFGEHLEWLDRKRELSGLKQEWHNYEKRRDAYYRERYGPKTKAPATRGNGTVGTE